MASAWAGGAGSVVQADSYSWLHCSAGQEQANFPPGCAVLTGGLTGWLRAGDQHLLLGGLNDELEILRQVRALSLRQLDELHVAPDGCCVQRSTKSRSGFISEQASIQIGAGVLIGTGFSRTVSSAGHGEIKGSNGAKNSTARL